MPCNGKSRRGLQQVREGTSTDLRVVCYRRYLYMSERCYVGCGWFLALALATGEVTRGMLGSVWWSSAQRCSQ